MQYAYNKFRTQVVFHKSNLQPACDCRVQHKECHILKPCDNHSHWEFYIKEQAACAIKINRKQKLYRVIRPLERPSKLCMVGKVDGLHVGNFLESFEGSRMYDCE